MGDIYKAKLFLLNGKELGGTTPPKMYYMSEEGYNVHIDYGKRAIVKNDTGYVEFVVPDFKLKKPVTIKNWGARVTQKMGNGSDTAFYMTICYAVTK